jgi:hypothetical protein
MPLLHDRYRQKQFVKISETDYQVADAQGESLHITICVPNIAFNDVSLKAKYGNHVTDKVNFVEDIKSFVLAHDNSSFKRKVEQNGGNFKFNLNSVEVVIRRNEDFFFNASEMASAE